MTSTMTHLLCHQQKVISCNKLLNLWTSNIFNVKVIYHLWVSWDSSVVFSHLASWAIYHHCGKAVGGRS
jgi:hypothetical protein